jgi:cellulose synthase/poly-beta-1,6-N-acetylglucosamine synthase-like glycosyltransferase
MSLAILAVSAALLAYTYAGYPACLWLASRILGQRPYLRDPALRPSVTVLVAALDEELHIAGRLRNLAASSYPAGRLRVLVGSDGSTDATVRRARALGLANVEVVDFPERRGKIGVLNRLAAMADSELLAFTDANTEWAPDALEQLAAPFADPEVGGVSGRLSLRAVSGDTEVERGYWDFESWLKQHESCLWTTIGANGAIYAIRRELWRPLPEDRPLMDDFVVGCRVVEAGRRLLFEPRARAWEATTPALDLELRRKRRIFVANFHAVPVLRGLLRPGLPGLMYVSHKLLRWLSPLWLLAALGAGVVCRQSWPGRLALGVLGALLLAALLERLGARLGRPLALLRPAHYFVRLQWELARGLLVALFGRPAPAWERSARS